MTHMIVQSNRTAAVCSRQGHSEPTLGRKIPSIDTKPLQEELSQATLGIVATRHRNGILRLLRPCAVALGRWIGMDGFSCNP